MNKSIILAIASTAFGFSALHAGTISYQVTGPVLEITDAKIVVQKDTEKWEIARTRDTKVTGKLQVGAKVTIQYTMSANSIEVKPDEAPNKPAAPAAPAKKVK